MVVVGEGTAADGVLVISTGMDEICVGVSLMPAQRCWCTGFNIAQLPVASLLRKYDVTFNK